MSRSDWQIEHLKAVAKRAGLEGSGITLPESHDVVVGRMRLHYLDWGGPARPYLLFLHGGGLNAHTWDVICLALRTRYHCLALDLRGHGESEWSRDVTYSIDAYRADVEGFVDALEIDRFVLVGMSLGGLAALAYAGANSGRLGGLVIIDTGPTTQTAGSARVREFMQLPSELDSVEAFVARALEFNPSRDASLLRSSLLHNLQEMPNGKWTWKYDPRYRTRDGFATVDEARAKLWEVVPAIRCPTLVVRGGRSDVFSDLDAGGLAAKLPDGRWVVVPDAGHTVQGDNPRGLLDVMVQFLAPLEV